MIRLTITLPEDTAELLRREAVRRKSSVSCLAREAIEERFPVPRGEKRVLPFRYLVEGNGEPLSEMVDDILKAQWAAHIDSEQ